MGCKMLPETDFGDGESCADEVGDIPEVDHKYSNRRPVEVLTIVTLVDRIEGNAKEVRQKTSKSNTGKASLDLGVDEYRCGGCYPVCRLASKADYRRCHGSGRICGIWLRTHS